MMAYNKQSQIKKMSWAQRKPRQFFLLFSIIVLISLQFFNYVGFDSGMLKMLSMFLALVFTCFYTIPAIFKPKIHVDYYNIIRFITISYFISMLMAYVFWGQSSILTFRCSYNILYFGIFFFIIKYNPRISDLERFVKSFTILYMVVFLISLVIFPTVLFSVTPDKDLDVSRGLVRLFIGGDMFLYLSYFMYLNNYVETHKKKALIWVLICFLFIILHVTRQTIFITFAIGVIYVLKNRIKYCIAAIILFLFLYLWTPTIKVSDTSILGSLINLTESQQDMMQSGQENIRILEYKYFFTEYSSNFITSIFGSGMPHSESRYGRWYASLNMNQKMFLSDVGYGMMFAIYGLFGLVLYIFMYIKGAFKKVDNNYVYVRLFFVFLIFNNIASSVFMLADTIICTAICLYIYNIKKVRICANSDKS